MSERISDDCSELCAHDVGHHKWEISPHPADKSFCTYVCDEDWLARQALVDIVERIWDEIESGQEKTVTIRLRMNRTTAHGGAESSQADAEIESQSEGEG